MSKAHAVMYVELNVTCPECGHCFDLIADTSLNDDGWLVQQACPNHDEWIDRHESFECSAICPECSAEIEVKKIIW